MLISGSLLALTVASVWNIDKGMAHLFLVGFLKIRGMCAIVRPYVTKITNAFSPHLGLLYFAGGIFSARPPKVALAAIFRHVESGG
jgi:hypothetical protein